MSVCLFVYSIRGARPPGGQLPGPEACWSPNRIGRRQGRVKLKEKRRHSSEESGYVGPCRLPMHGRSRMVRYDENFVFRTSRAPSGGQKKKGPNRDENGVQCTERPSPISPPYEFRKEQLEKIRKMIYRNVVVFWPFRARSIETPLDTTCHGSVTR